MILSRETLITESNRTGFRAEILEKVIRLLDLLNAFSDDEYLRHRIALKGGTALNLFHFDVPRLSVDIDLNYIGSSEREIMLQEKPRVLMAIEKICSEKKYRNIHKPTEHGGGKWIVGYKSELIKQGQLEIDLNFQGTKVATYMMLILFSKVPKNLIVQKYASLYSFMGHQQESIYGKFPSTTLILILLR